MNKNQLKIIFSISIFGLLILLGCENTSKKKEVKYLEKIQNDKTLFNKTLKLNGIGFKISSIKDGNETAVTISPFGLTEVNRAENIEIDGRVIGAKIADLNADDSPEILIYTQSDGSGSYGTIIGYSVNNKKSMSQIYFPPIFKNNKINEGYMGHDEFTIVENKLVQKFPIYKERDTNSEPTGGYRQITYKLVDGEAGRRFEIEKITIINN